MLDLASPLDGMRSPFGARRGFSDMSFFIGGALGLLYKPRPAVLFVNATGTPAVAVASDPAGLIFDDSKGLVLGSERFAETGPFTSAAGWSPYNAGSVALNGSSIQVTGAAATNTGAYYPFVTKAGANYKYRYTYRFGTASTLDASFSASDIGGGASLTGLSGTSYKNITANGSAEGFFTATDTLSTFNFLVRGAGLTGFLDTITVYEVPGNHAYLSGANTLRPAYQDTPKRLVFDGSDDRLLTALNPTASGTIAARMRGTTASKVAIGSMGATDGRAFLALAADGSLAAGIGADSTATIKGTVDDRNAWVTGIVTWDGSTVKLYRNGTQVYSAAQNGAVNTTVPWMLGCLNNNATAASFWGGDIGAVEILNRAMTLAEVASISNLWSTIQ